jgi:hypothetical protein
LQVVDLLVDLTSASLNSLADLIRGLKPFYAECTSIINNNMPVQSGTCSPTRPVRARGCPAALRRRSAADNPSKEPLSVPERSMARYDRGQLYEDVWSMPLWKAAQKHGLDESTLRLVCRRLHIPAPGLGYWSKSAAVRTAEPKPSHEVGRRFIHRRTGRSVVCTCDLVRNERVEPNPELQIPPRPL